MSSSLGGKLSMLGVKWERICFLYCHIKVPEPIHVSNLKI